MTALHKYRNLGIIVALAILAAASNGRAAAPRGGAPAGGAASGAAQELLNRLNSNNPAERAAAQKQAAVYFDLLVSPDALQKLADAATNDAVKDVLRERVAQLRSRDEARRSAALPPLSLNVQNASLQEIVDTLNKPLHGTLSRESAADSGFAGSFTLHVTDKPFWEIFAALHVQHPLSLWGISGPPPSLQVTTARTTPAAVAIDGPAIAFVNGISLQRTVGSESEGSARKSTLSVAYVVAFDPRLDVARFELPVIANAVDDRGQAYPTGEGTRGPKYMNGMITPPYQYALTAPAEIGKKLSFTLDTTVDISVVSEVATIADMEHDVNKLVVFGDRTWRVSRFEPIAAAPARGRATAATAPGRYNIAIESSVPQKTGPVAPALDSSTQLVILDGTGKVIWRNKAFSGNNSTTITASTPPYKLEIRTYASPVSLPIHFQFKDVPLP